MGSAEEEDGARTRDRDAELQMCLSPSQERPKGRSSSQIKPSALNQVALSLQGRAEPVYSLSPGELCCSLLPPSLADASGVLWLSPVAICPFKTHLTARNQDPYGNKSEAAISGGARASSFGRDI